MSSPELLEHALGYAAGDWSVFPVCSPARGSGCTEHGQRCESPGKTPLIRWACAQERLADDTQIHNWWHRWPTANIGLATGHLSGVCVIDIDGAAALAEAQRRGLPHGPSVATGRIGGRHLYCAWRDNAPTIFARAGGIDFRGEGGYVVLPPSRHKTGTVYTWTVPPTEVALPPLPEWIDRMATTDRSGQKRGHIEVGRLFADGIPEGERDTTLFRVAAKLRAVDVPEDVALGVLLELGARCRPPFEPEHTRRKVEWVYTHYQPKAPVPATDVVVEPVGPRELELRRLRERPFVETVEL